MSSKLVLTFLIFLFLIVIALIVGEISFSGHFSSVERTEDKVTGAGEKFYGIGKVTIVNGSITDVEKEISS